jgi:hypothetical protein
MSSTTNKALVVSRVRTYLSDQDIGTWTRDSVEEGIRQALSDYSHRFPLSVIGELTLTSDTREIDISSLTGLIEIDQVWLPYDSADPQWPPNRRGYEHWFDQQVLYIPDDDGRLNEYYGEPSSGDVARIFYSTPHSLDGLDSATSTTFRDNHLYALINGSAGYAAVSRAIDLTEKVTKSDKTVVQVVEWGKAQLEWYRSELDTLAARSQARESAWVVMPPIDRYDTGGW